MDGLQSRNRLWLSDDVAERLERTDALIIGCGGTGSLVALECAHLGVRRLRLCDPDVVELSNLNRLLWATPADEGRGKAETLAAYLRGRRPELELDVLPVALPHHAATDACAAASMTFGCIDTVQTRLELDVLCRHYGRLLIDLGTGFAADDSGTIVAAGGQVLLSRPDGPCLQCLGFTPTSPPRAYHLPGRRGPEPSSLLLNAVVSALAVECLVAELGAQPPQENRLQYDARRRSMVAELGSGRRDCAVCGTDSAANLSALGDRDVLPTGGRG